MIMLGRLYRKGANAMDGLIYVGGAFRPAGEAAVSVLDHGLLYGDGIFEGIRAYNGRVFRLERHIQRLFESAQANRPEIPGNPPEAEAPGPHTRPPNGSAGGDIPRRASR